MRFSGSIQLHFTTPDTHAYTALMAPRLRQFQLYRGFISLQQVPALRYARLQQALSTTNPPVFGARHVNDIYKVLSSGTSTAAFLYSDVWKVLADSNSYCNVCSWAFISQDKNLLVALYLLRSTRHYTDTWTTIT